MQEPVSGTVRKKSTFAIVLAAVIAGVVIVTLAVCYGIFSSSYNNNLDKLKELVSQADAQLGNGSDQPTLSAEIAFYRSMDGKVTDLGGILTKLNERYPFLLGRGTEETVGIVALAGKTQELAPKLDELTDCIGEDEGIHGKLAELLAGGAAEGLSASYTDLATRNDSLAIRVGALSFTGMLEEKRQAFASGVARHQAVLDYLVDDSAINEELAALLADKASKPEDLQAKYLALAGKNDALTGQAGAVNLTDYGAGETNLGQMLADRKALIGACAQYQGELAPVYVNVAKFCEDLSKGVSPQGKFTQKLAAYMDWVKQLKELQKQLAAVNGKEEYKIIAAKRSVADLGMSPEGQTLLSYEKALTAVSTGLTTSQTLEKQIDALIKDTKTFVPTKVASLDTIDGKNKALIASLAAEVPPELLDGLQNFTAACKERGTFLTEYIAYVQSKSNADGFMDTYHFYLIQRQDFLTSATYYEGLGDAENAKFYKNLAEDQLTLANAQKAMYNSEVKLVNSHKKAYEASRKKYQGLLAK